MINILPLLPSVEGGYLPYYLFVVSITAIGNSLQNLVTLHYTRRIYNGHFVPNPSLSRAPATAKYNPEDSVSKLVPASSTGKDVEKARDQMTPLAARLFGTWTLITGFIRLYAAYDVNNAALYQLSILTHMLAAAHFTSEFLVYKTTKMGVPLGFPMVAGWGGTIWMLLQYRHYIGS